MDCTASRNHKGVTMNVSQEPPVFLISPEARANLAAEVDRGGGVNELVGGLLFGYPIGEDERLIVDSLRLSPDVGFGRRDFSLDQTRTSRQLERAQSLDPKATYCGLWYLHRTPNRELADAEWVQAQTLLEDPDFSFEDLVCLVLCFYGGELTIYPLSFTRYHSARGQAPDPTSLRLTTDWHEKPVAVSRTVPDAASTAWYRATDVAARLTEERARLTEGYRVESSVASDEQMFFRLSPKHKHEKLAFYLAIQRGFPQKAPHVFLLVAGKPYRISTPRLGSWSAETGLVDVADELVKWLAFSVDDYIKRAKEALGREAFREASDLLTLVLAIDPRTPGAARLLAQAQARL
jgi:hypothetical protein